MPRTIEVNMRNSHYHQVLHMLLNTFLLAHQISYTQICVQKPTIACRENANWVFNAMDTLFQYSLVVGSSAVIECIFLFCVID